MISFECCVVDCKVFWAGRCACVGLRRQVDTLREEERHDSRARWCRSVYFVYSWSSRLVQCRDLSSSFWVVHYLLSITEIQITFIQIKNSFDSIVLLILFSRLSPMYAYIRLKTRGEVAWTGLCACCLFQVSVNIYCGWGGGVWTKYFKTWRSAVPV